MTGIPPPRHLMRMLLLAVAVVAAACGSVRPSASPATSPDAVGPSARPATAGPPGGDPFEGLLALRRGELLLVDAGGAMRPVDVPEGRRVELASTAGGTIAVRTADGRLHVATVAGADVPPLSWRALELDPGVARRPLSLMGLSPDARHLAVLAATFGNAEPFEVLLVDLDTAGTRVVAVGREPNGPPVWVDRSTLLLEVVAGAAGGPFLRLDSGTGAVEGVAARGFGPAISAEGGFVALPDEAGGVRLLSVADWLAGAEPATGEAIGAPDGVLQVAVDAGGRRIAMIASDSAGAPVSLAVYRREDGGWALAGRMADERTRWIGWLR